MPRKRICPRKGALALILLGGCGTSTSEPDGPGLSDFDNPPIPPAGAFFTVPPVPMDRIANLSAFGHNNKVMPTNKVYIRTCDYGLTDRPCHLEHLPVRAPGDALVFSVHPISDGEITLEGPPGLFASFVHITPTPGLSVGDSVRAGDVVGTMFYLYGLDFGLVDFSVTRDFVNPQRLAPGYLYTENPLARYAEPVRSELLGLVHTLEEPLGRIEYDVAGTASGLWYLEGSPMSDEVGSVDWVHAQLFMGPLAEYFEIDVVVTGAEWGGFRIAAVDPDAPRWEEVTPASGRVQLRLWELGFEFDLRPEPVRGSLLVEMLDAETVRLEWFDTHDDVSEFTSGALTYER